MEPGAELRPNLPRPERLMRSNGPGRGAHDETRVGAGDYFITREKHESALLDPEMVQPAQSPHAQKIYQTAASLAKSCIEMGGG